MKKKSTDTVVTAVEEPSPLKVFVEQLEGAAKVRPAIVKDAVAEAREALKPVVAEAQRALAEVRALKKEHGELLDRLDACDWVTARIYKVPEHLIARAHHIVREVKMTLTRTEPTLVEIPYRVQRLTHGDLQKMNLSQEYGVRGGQLFSVEPARIRKDVETLKAVPGYVRARIAELAYLLSQMSERMASAGVALPVWTPVRPSELEDEVRYDERDPEQGVVKTDFDPFDYGDR